MSTKLARRPDTREDEEQLIEEIAAPPAPRWTRWCTIILLAGTTLVGALDGAAWVIGAAAFGLTCVQVEAREALVERHVGRYGPLATWGIFLAVWMFGNAATCAAAYFLGRAIAAAVTLVTNL